MRRHLGIAAGLGLLLVVLSVTNAGPALAQTFKPVMSLIVNDSANPVPVTGTMVVRDANAPALQPFRAQASIQLTGSFPLPRPETVIATVPAGKRLVIEDISWSASCSTGHQITEAWLRNNTLGAIFTFLRSLPRTRRSMVFNRLAADPRGSTIPLARRF
jgi:hypothetical protein